MIVLLILNIGIAALIFLAKPNNKSNQYLSSLCMLYGLDIFFKLSRDFFIYNSSFDIIIGSHGFRNEIMILLYVLNTFTYFSVPLLYFIFSIKYSNLSEWWLKNTDLAVRFALAVSTIAAILFLDIFFPISYYAYNLRSGSRLLPFYLWNIILLAASDYLLITSCFLEIKPRLQKERLIMCTVLAPCVTLSILLRYAFTLLRIQDTYNSISLVQSAFCILFLYCFARYGLMGLKLNIEHYELNRYNSSISSGKAIIRHTIKNELTKVSICLQTIKFLGKENADVENSINIIEKSIDQLKSLIYQLNEESKKIKLDILLTMVYDLVDEVILSAAAFKNEKNITVINLCDPGLELYCDRTQTEKALENILLNSMDAIDGEGIIEISSVRNAKITSIVIKDNGKGISEENLKHVTEPYFTTKKGNSNFGLGLYHCYNLMEEHGGYLSIQSTEGNGTTVALNFPNARHYKNHTLQRWSMYADN